MRIQLLALIACGAAFAQTPKIGDGGILNGADFQKGKPITPGSLISIFGTQLASRTAQADSIPLSTSLGGVTVQFVTDTKTATAPLLFVAPDNAAAGASSQINAQVPWDLIPNNTTATVNVVVTNNGVASAPTAVTVGPFSPGLFTSGNRAIAVNDDGSLAWPTGAVAGVNSHPAKVGDVVTIYATGLGAVDIPAQTGNNSLDQLRHTLVTPIITIGGVTAQVLFSGLSPQFVGVNQLNVTIPSVTAGDAVQIQIQTGGVTTPAGVTIAVSQ
ncbi:MAG: hypothetical protein JO022_02035 [Acidobacteriaceae bacterium]|nr:hypothetical protein [Acidobacteriaceae bacterium]